MIPILSTVYPVVGNGLGGLNDCIECKVTREINGEYDLRMRYPITGNHFDEMETDQFIIASVSNDDPNQPFRIYRITKPLNGIVTIYAHHISYDMSGIIITPFAGTSLSDSLTQAAAAAIPDMQSFTLATTKTSNTTMTMLQPRPLWKLLGGQEGSLLDIYGGEWDFNGRTATLKAQIGQNNGVVVRRGKNLTKLEAEEDLSSTYGGVFPYYYDEESGYVAPSGPVLISGSPYSRILLLDCSDDYDNAPTTTQLQNKASAYITANSVGSPKKTWKINFVQLAQTKEYSDQASMELVALGDTVQVIDEVLDVNITARATKIEWNVLTDQYISVTLGRVRQNLADILVGNNDETQTDIGSLKGDQKTQRQLYPVSPITVNDLHDTSLLPGYMYQYTSSAANLPVSGTGGHLVVTRYKSSTALYMTVRAYPNASRQQEWLCEYSNGTWTDWQRQTMTLTETFSTSGSTASYTIPVGTAIVTTARQNSTSTTQDGLWLVSVGSSNSHISAIKTPSGGTTVTLSGSTLSLTTGAANVRITINNL